MTAKATRRWLAASWLLGVATGCGGPGAPEPSVYPAPIDAPATAFDAQRVSVYLVLSGPSAAALLRSSTLRSAGSAAALARHRLREMASQHDELRAQLEMRGAKVEADLRRLANAIQVRVTRAELPSLAQLPGVVRIEPVTTVWPTLASSVPQVGAPALWSGSIPYTGAGVRVGVIDSGIDYTHADFGGSGDPADYEDNDPTRAAPGEGFPSARVVGGVDLAGDEYDPANSEHDEPVPDDDPLDCSKKDSPRDAGGHGTHVAGVLAGGGVLLDGSSFEGPYEQSLDPSAFLIHPGVAPAAQLYAIKVFGCSGGSQLAAAALEWAADPDGDGDLGDRLDVVNASIGTVYGLGSPIEAELIDNLVSLGTVVVMAGGNDGATFFTVNSPGVVPAALSVAASQTPELLALEVLSPPAVAGRLPAAEAGFTQRLAETGPITAPLRRVDPRNACADLANATELRDQVALVHRGTCTFVDKLERIAAAGARAAVLVDDEEADLPIVMGGEREVAMPAVAIRRTDGLAIEAELGSEVVVRLDGAESFDELNTETVAEFSSRGPSAIDARLKPELAAPGTSIDSAHVATGIASRRAQGTSVATPLVAGGAALLRQAHPAGSWTSSDIKALLMNTAVSLETDEGVAFPVSMMGAGRMDLAQAAACSVTARVAAEDGSVAVSFGSLVALEPTSVSRSILVTNHGADAVTFDVAPAQTHPIEGVGLMVTPEVLSVAGHDQATVTLTLTVDPHRLGAPGPDPLTWPTQDQKPRHFLTEAAGMVRFTNLMLGPSLTLPFHGVVRAASQRAAAGQSKCVVARRRATVLVDRVGPSAHPEPVVSAFELGILHPPRPGADERPAVAAADVRAVGVASSYRTAPTLADTQLSFGIAIAGEWTTPARGPHHPVGIYLDTDLDGETDYYTLPEPLSQDGPYADVLLSVTYDAETREPVDSSTYVNLVPADAWATHPFFNSVLTLGVPAGVVGLTEQSPEFAYAAFAGSRDPDVDREQTEWARYDPTSPRVDATAVSLEPGVPLFGPTGPVRLDIDLTTEGAAPQALLLHHSNVAGARHEVVSFGSWDDDALVMDHYTSPATEPGGRVYARLAVRNETDHEVAGVRLDGRLVGGAVELVATSGGSCRRAGRISCALGALAPGASVDVSIQGRASSSLGPGEAAELDVAMSSSDGCEVTLAATAAVPIPLAPELAPEGGCRCAAASRRPGQAVWLSLLSALCVAWARRRRHAPDAARRSYGSTHSSSS